MGSWSKADSAEYWLYFMPVGDVCLIQSGHRPLDVSRRTRQATRGSHAGGGTLAPRCFVFLR
jgi:hypothetical protein